MENWIGGWDQGGGWGRDQEERRERKKEKETEETLQDIEMGRDFWGNSFKTENKREIKQMGFYQNKKILLSKGALNRVQREPIKQEKIFTSLHFRKSDTQYTLLKKI